MANLGLGYFSIIIRDCLAPGSLKKGSDGICEQP